MIGRPLFFVSSSYNDAELASIASAMRSSSRARSVLVSSGHGPDSKAILAMWTASSTSAAVCSGTVAMTSPVAGLTIDRRLSARPISASRAAKTLSMFEGAVLVSVIGLLSTENPGL